MKKSARALVGMAALDAVFVGGAAWFVGMIKSGGLRTTVPPAEAITTITTYAGGLIGVVTVILALAFVHHRRNGN